MMAEDRCSDAEPAIERDLVEDLCSTASQDSLVPSVDRITFRLSQSTQSATEDLMRLGGFATMQEAIRNAIGDALYLRRLLADGWQVLIRKEDVYRALVFSPPTEPVELRERPNTDPSPNTSADESNP